MSAIAREINTENAGEFAPRVHSILRLYRTTLAGWARKRKYPMTTVHQAVHGTRRGKKTLKIRAELERLLNAKQ